MGEFQLVERNRSCNMGQQRLRLFSVGELMRLICELARLVHRAARIRATHSQGAIFAILACATFPAFVSASRAAVPIPPAAFSPLPGRVFPYAHLPEPLIATSTTTAAQDEALRLALNLYDRRAEADDLSTLQGYIASNPHSGWSAAVMTNIGALYTHYGYYSRALIALQGAWNEGRNATAPNAKAMIDGALGRTVKLYASLGQFDRLRSLLDEVESRPISGSATEAFQIAHETLKIAKTGEGHFFNCGPMALYALMRARGVDSPQVRKLPQFKASPDGTSLADLARLADTMNLDYRLVRRMPGDPIPPQAIIHWKVGHFAAIVGLDKGHIHVKDSILPSGEIWVTPAALDAETSGYMLVPADQSGASGLQSIANSEAASIRGTGQSSQGRPGDLGDPPANPPQSCPLCAYNIAESSVAVTLSDTPVGYDPPTGPSMRSTLSYNQRNDWQPQNFSFSNIGPKWSLNLVSYIQDDPTTPGNNVIRYMQDGSAFYYDGYNSSTGSFTQQDVGADILQEVAQSPVSYTLRQRDGSVLTYASSDGSTSYPRNIYLTSAKDPQGNAVQYQYDVQNRLTTITDATGRKTTLGYGNAVYPMVVTQITDPFSRSANLTYDAVGRLSSITDILGLTSSFSYDVNGLITALKTPYGTTAFAFTAPNSDAPPRFVDVTDPLGNHEREEWVEPAPGLSMCETAIPQGMVTEDCNSSPYFQYLQYRDSFHWDKEAYVAAGCTVSGGCDYTKARDTHFLHYGYPVKSTTVESIKYPLENRVWYNYPNQAQPVLTGSSSNPTFIGRVLDDNSTQLWQYSYDSAGFYLPTQVIDPMGRITNLTYQNHLDLLSVSQATGSGASATLAGFTYDSHHRPLTYTDAAAQVTTYSYNTAEQLLTATDPLSHKTTYTYNGTSDLKQITNANSKTAAAFTYDTFDRIATFTDSEGWVVSYQYDAADRITKVTYPDGTSESYAYDKLDLASYQDRLGRKYVYTHDANRDLTAVLDPGRQIVLIGYDRDGRLKTLTDPSSNVTTWSYDIEGRLTGKKYADASTQNYVYENTTSRLKSVKDAMSQTKQFGYAKDDALSAITYLNAAHTTPNVTFTYDANYPRLATMVDGNGTTQYSYYSPGSLGALHVQQETGSRSASNIVYGYDVAGRLVSRKIDSEGIETLTYDAINRLLAHVSDLGTFTYGWLGQTGQIAQRALPSPASLKTVWSYQANANDRRLAEIDNAGLSNSQYSNFVFTSDAMNEVTSVNQTTDTAKSYPVNAAEAAVYNNLNQQTSYAGMTQTFDAAGNMLSDGLRTYIWDAEHRLIEVDYPNQSGKKTEFAYDGLGRRTSITSTPAGGGSATVSSFIWCGTSLCQARNASNVTTREYIAEGEYVSGTSPQALYYGVDQLGSIRRAFATTASAPAFDYDPYGRRLSTATPTTDMGYGGLYYQADSGLNLAMMRPYNPTNGRWLTRDPAGEGMDPTGNLYAYVGGNATNRIDPLGLCSMPQRGRPAYCFSAPYRIGKDLDNLGKFGQKASLGIAGLGVYGLVADGAGLGLIGVGLTGYNYSSYVRLIGGGLKAYAGSPLDQASTISGLALNALTAAFSVPSTASVPADVASNPVLNKYLPQDPCQ